MRLTFAILVHLYTASGAFLAFGALLYATNDNFSASFFMLMIAMLVDYTDGTLARFFKLKEIIPLIDGSVLDHIVDFTTSAFLPAFILWQANLLPYPRILWMVLMLSTTLYRFTKTFNPWIENGFFVGIPTPWITLSFYLYYYNPEKNVTAALIAVLSLLTFLPLKFIHIARHKDWRLANIIGLGCWWAIYLAITQGLIINKSLWLNISIAYPAFYIIASWLLGHFGITKRRLG